MSNTREIPDADEVWDPDEGEELIGCIQDFGWDKSTDHKALNIRAEDSNKLFRVWRWKPEELAAEWKDVEPEEGMCVRIKYLGEKEIMKKGGSDESPSFPDFEVEVLENP